MAQIRKLLIATYYWNLWGHLIVSDYSPCLATKFYATKDNWETAVQLTTNQAAPLRHNPHYISNLHANRRYWIEGYKIQE